MLKEPGDLVHTWGMETSLIYMNDFQDSPNWLHSETLSQNLKQNIKSKTSPPHTNEKKSTKLGYIISKYI